MEEPTQQQRATSTGFCVDCRAWRLDVTLIRILEQGSGPGRGLYACPDHVDLHAADIAALNRQANP